MEHVSYVHLSHLLANAASVSTQSVPINYDLVTLSQSQTDLIFSGYITNPVVTSGRVETTMAVPYLDRPRGHTIRIWGLLVDNTISLKVSKTFKDEGHFGRKKMLVRVQTRDF